MQRNSFIRSRTILFLWVVLSGLFFYTDFSYAQQGQKPADKTIDEAIRKAVLEEAIKLVKDNYVFVEMGNKVAADIERRMKNGEYDKITSALEFAETLTKHFQEVSKDKHMYVRVMSGSSANPFTPEQARAKNYGFSKAEILPNNIGYLKINEFPPPEMAARTLAAAMNFLANTDALIIDLREHRGGAVPTVALTVSYFIPEKRVQLLTVSSPRTGFSNESWTLEKIDGPRYLDRPVYLLTSSKTFSGGEEFAYDMQALKRATLIGETTGGGANPVRLFPVQNIFAVGVSIMQVKNTITGTNWEGKGVKPEIETPVEQALQKAQEIANKQLQELKTGKQTVALTQSTQSTPFSETKLSETRAGKTMSSFLKAFNSGELDIMRKFHTDIGTPQKVADENAKQDFDFYQNSGGLTPHSITELSEFSVTLIVQTKNGNWLKFKMALEKTAPYGLANLMVEEASKP